MAPWALMKFTDVFYLYHTGLRGKRFALWSVVVMPDAVCRISLGRYGMAAVNHFCRSVRRSERWF